jgi:hypothetical protein
MSLQTSQALKALLLALLATESDTQLMLLFGVASSPSFVDENQAMVMEEKTYHYLTRKIFQSHRLPKIRVQANLDGF